MRRLNYERKVNYEKANRYPDLRRAGSPRGRCGLNADSEYDPVKQGYSPQVNEYRKERKHMKKESVF